MSALTEWRVIAEAFVSSTRTADDVQLLIAECVRVRTEHLELRLHAAEAGRDDEVAHLRDGYREALAVIHEDMRSLLGQVADLQRQIRYVRPAIMPWDRPAHQALDAIETTLARVRVATADTSDGQTSDDRTDNAIQETASWR